MEEMQEKISNSTYSAYTSFVINLPTIFSTYNSSQPRLKLCAGWILPAGYRFSRHDVAHVETMQRRPRVDTKVNYNIE